MNQLSFDLDLTPSKPVVRLQRWEKFHQGWKGEFTILEERQMRKGVQREYQCDIYRPDGKWETYLQVISYSQFSIEKEFCDTVDTYVNSIRNTHTVGFGKPLTSSPVGLSGEDFAVDEGDCHDLIKFANFATGILPGGKICASTPKERSHFAAHFTSAPFNWELERLNRAIAFCLERNWLEAKHPSFPNLAAALNYDEESQQLLVSPIHSNGLEDIKEVASDTKQAQNHDDNVLEQVYNSTAPELSASVDEIKDTAPELSIRKQSQWVESYCPSKRKAYYYRYCWREGSKIKHIHIPGGSNISALANSRVEKVKSAIALGKTSAEIKQLIQDLRGGDINRQHSQ